MHFRCAPMTDTHRDTIQLLMLQLLSSVHHPPVHQFILKLHAGGQIKFVIVGYLKKLTRHRALIFDSS